MSHYHLNDASKLPLVDDLSASPQHIATEKVANTAIEEARVLSYDAVTHTAWIMPLTGASANNPILARVLTHFQGAKPGEGEAAALVYGHHVRYAMTGGHMGGLANTAVIIGAPFLPGDQQAPAYAPFQATNGGKVTVAGNFKHAEHLGADGRQSRSSFVQAQVEEVGSHTVVGGTNQPRAEEQIREAATLMERAVSVLTGGV